MNQVFCQLGFRPRGRLARPALGFAAALAWASLAPGAAAQTSFSIDWQGPPVGFVGGCAVGPLTPADLLVPFPAGVPGPGPLPPPCIAVPGGVPGVGLLTYAGCAGTPAGVPCPFEVDALSYGLDGPLMPGPPGHVKFSVDRHALGIPGAPLPPNVMTEAPFGDAASDVFLDIGLPPGPLPPGPIMGNLALFDGDGLPGLSGFVYPGLGLIEPAPPAAGLPNPGSDLDALDVDGPVVAGFSYVSLDGALVDPLTGLAGLGTAAANGFAPADVLFSAGGLAPVVYAGAAALGLDLVGGPGSDDLDALALFENGLPGYQPSMVPYDWLGGGTDMLLFSVRRGSAVLGAPDSIFGAPIEAGDILVPPLAGGVSPFPGIFYPAEALGLGGFFRGPPMGGLLGDDLDALDVTLVPVFDCDGDLIEDPLAIALGFVPDCNGNGVPDGCESLVSVHCTAKTNSLGCVPTIAGVGTPSLSCGLPFRVAATNVRNNKAGLLFYGLNGPAALPFQGGTLCVATPVRRTPAQFAGGTPLPAQDCSGAYSIDMVAFAAGALGGAPHPALSVAGTVVNCQWWSRDQGFPAPNNTGLTDGLSYTTIP